MDECGEQLKCAGFFTTAGVLFPEMEDSMSFSDFFALIGVYDYEYGTDEDNASLGWLNFVYHDMEVWLDTKSFATVEKIKTSAPVSIVDKEIFHQNQALANMVMFE